MALQGTIESFGISEIFQLIDHQGKSGTLQIHTSDGVARIRFLDGRLIEAWSDQRSPAELIGSRLVRAGLVTPVQLGHALEQQRHNLRRIGDILTRMGAVRISEFQALLAVQHRETVYKLLRLKRGRFEFVPEGVELEEGVSLPMDVGGVLMEGFRQIDEWPDLLKKIPSEKSVYARLEAEAVPAKLPALQAKVLGLVDGVRTVREVVDLTRAGDFGGWEALVGLFDRGLITPVGAVRRIKPEVRPVYGGRAGDWVVGTALVAAGVALVLLSSAARFDAFRALADGLEQVRGGVETVDARARTWANREPLRWPPLTR
ncbi:MAG: DUF4388 domain-containing protein [Deferrisomatales bacterium]|nr:DUF4388 domain-containing protein [Deferrisomatales bacterium]